MVFLSAPLLQIDIGKLLGGAEPRHLATKRFFPKLFLVLSQFGSWDKAQCDIDVYVPDIKTDWLPAHDCSDLDYAFRTSRLTFSPLCVRLLGSIVGRW
jgi:hypothetical protein